MQRKLDTGNFKPLDFRSSGVLLHITSLPGPHGIGDLGPAAYWFVDRLAEAGQTWWQILPLGPAGNGNSPYQCFSAFAGNTALLSPDLLQRDGLIGAEDGRRRFPRGHVDYRRVLPYKAAMLEQAWERFEAGAANTLRAECDRFCHEQAWWLDDFAAFMAIAELHPHSDWTRWPAKLKLRDPAALQEFRREHAGRIGRQKFGQFLFFRQLDALRDYAAERGIYLLGDMPIFVSCNSADVWANPQLFLLDRQRKPKFVAGVPPDIFCATGQRWGNPLYDWRAMQRHGFAWWMLRLKASLRQASLVRIDHFRGFAACWQIPEEATTAESGKWVKSPGAALFKTAANDLQSLPFVAEDLGLITPDVIALRQSLRLPGMRVLQFAFGGDAENPHLPHNHEQNGIAYTGTHDNDTTAGWYRALPAKHRAHLHQYLGLKPKMASTELCWAMIRAAWSSVANGAIAPVQDLLALPSSARMNTPGKSDGNWRWRLAEQQLAQRHLDLLAEVTALFRRTASHPT